MTHEEEMEELRKCKESKVYFYNKYVKSPDDPELTERDVRRMELMCNPVIRRMRNPTAFIDKLMQAEEYANLPEFLKK